MSWIKIIWSINAGICITLAAVHLMVWLRNRSKRISLTFSVWTIAVAFSAIFEIAMLNAQSTVQYGELVRWIHIPLAVATIAYVWFIRQYLRAGRLWLLWVIFGVSAAMLLVNFVSEPNVNFSEITALRYVSILGEKAAVPIGVPGAWGWISRVNVAMILLFIVDAAIAAWRQDRRRQTIMMIVAIFFSSIGSVLFSTMVVEGKLAVPITVSVPSLIVVLVMAYELSRELVHSYYTSEKLKQEQERVHLIAGAVDLGIWEWDVSKDEIWINEENRACFNISECERISFDRFIRSVHPDDRERIQRAMHNALEGGGEFSAEYRTISTDGKTCWILTRGRVERGKNGKPLFMRGISMDITNHKHAEDALRVSEEKFRQFFKNSPDYCYIVSTEGNILHINHAALNTLGYSREELIGQPLAKIYAPESLGKMQDLLNRWKQTGNIRDEEMVLLTRNGERRIVMLNVGSVRDKDGTILHSTSIQTDITSIKQTEARERKLQAYRGMGHKILSILNGPNGFQDSMKQVLSELKASIGVDAVGIRLEDNDDFPYYFQDGFSDDFLRKENSLLKRSRDGGICRDAEGKVSLECTCGLVISGKTDPSNPLFTRDGSAWTNDSFPLLDLPSHEDPRTNPRNECIHQGYASIALIPITAKGKIVGLLQLNNRRKGLFNLETVELLEGIAENIGEALLRKQTEDALKKSEERLKEAQRIAHIGNWELDLVTDTLIWSDEIYSIFEIDPKHFGASYEAFLEAVHPEDRKAVNTAYTKSLEMRKPYEITHRLRMTDGRIKYVHEQCETFYNPEGKPLRSIGTVQDITGQKQAEEQTASLRTELFHATRAGAMVEFTAALAHEINNPLGSILNNANVARRLLKRGNPDQDEFRAIIADIISEVQRANDVIHNVRSLMKKDKVELYPLHVNRIIEDILQLSHRELVLRDILLTKQLAKNLPRLKGERVQLQQVILNLIVNAADAMKKIPEKKLYISTELYDSRNIIICVKDTGSGIDEKIKDSLFKPFFTTKKKGMGFGLSVSKTIIEAHQGTIWYENNKQGGASFYVKLPVIKEELS